ncbi:zinc finger protein [Macleaya cordata]|uniref:RBR-type E3 ubiquitin transferase n=1 Tax=Macleaya cordata TaxID=56857 RepID=A0A200QRD9_MACCD|nr:zinc finger protein [Macleaya cordata]
MGDGEVGLIEIFDLEKDFFYTPITRRGRNKEDAISVEQYYQDRDLQRAIRDSILQVKAVIDLSGEEDEEEVVEIKPTRAFEKKPFVGRSVTETGESSSSSSSSRSSKKVSTFVCEICVETKLQNEAFNIKGCRHSFCSECMVRYVASKIQENVTSIGCPEMNCQGVLEPEFCQSILPPEVFDRWGKALCESLILGAQKFYCPFKDCSALLLDDNGGMVVRESECPYCRRLFCAQCKVSWHAGIVCEEFQKLNVDEREREDIMLMEIAKKQKWQRCPKCKFYVERSVGCLFIRCRCGFSFCYNCGAPLKDHYCSNYVKDVMVVDMPSKKNAGAWFEAGVRDSVVKVSPLYHYDSGYEGLGASTRTLDLNRQTQPVVVMAAEKSALPSTQNIEHASTSSDMSSLAAEVARILKATPTSAATLVLI